MNSSFDWVKEYYSWLASNTYSRLLAGDWTEIGTPFLDRHNDGLVLYARMDGARITLTDDGYILGDLLADGYSLKGENRLASLNRILAAYGIKKIKNELVMYTSADQYGSSMHLFIRGLLTIGDMFATYSRKKKSVFIETVKSFLTEKDIIYTPNFSTRGSTGLEFNFDFQIAGRSSEILIKSFNSINHQSLAAFLFDWSDIREERIRKASKDVRGLAIINDIEQSINGSYLAALDATKTSYILFSQRFSDDNQKKLIAA